MLRLPGRISAQLQDIRGRALPVPDVLIAINVLYEGRYYYGNLLGVTNPSGRAEITRDELELRFASDKVNYPMDYKVNLIDADPLMEVVLLTENEIIEAEAAADAHDVVSADIRALYHRARNATFTPALARFWADLPGVEVAAVSLTTKPL